MKRNAYHGLLYQAALEEYGLECRCPAGAMSTASRLDEERRRLSDPSLAHLIIRVVDDETVWIVSCPAEKMNTLSASTLGSTSVT